MIARLLAARRSSPPPSRAGAGVVSRPLEAVGLGLSLAVILVAFPGCTTTPQQPKQPPGLPPTPTTVSVKEPGGDADNPEVAALDRLGVEPWGLRVDRQDSMLVPLTDHKNWKRVKFKLVPSWTGFRYGDKHHGISALYFRAPPVPDPTSDQCLVDFENWARGLVSKFEAKITDAETTQIKWRGKDITVRSREGSGSLIFYGTRSYAVTYAAYPIWGGCAILGYGFPMKESAESAMRTRDRFAKEAFQRYVVKRKEPPPQ